MIQREVTDKENTRWTCVQAYSMTTNSTDATDALSGNDEGKVTVVCTPGGGAKTVRLALPKNWNDETNDEALLQAIETAFTEG
jgi:hypothetical protein